MLHGEEDVSYRVKVSGTPYFAFVPAQDEHGFYMAANAPHDKSWKQALAHVAPGDCVLDVGAHVGLFSLMACARGARVIAFEPAPINVACLEQTVRTNPGIDLTVLAVAVSDRSGRVDFTPDGPYGHVALAQDRSNLPCVHVEAVSIDDVLLTLGVSKVALVKVDVEGYECAVLDGMQNLLRSEDAPNLLCESNGHTLHWLGLTASDLKQRLENYGYENFRLQGEDLVPAPADEMQPETVEDYFSVSKKRVGTLQVRAGTTSAELAERIATCREQTHPDHLGHLRRELARFGRE